MKIFNNSIHTDFGLTRQRRRYGLAPVEMTLVLPFLMLFMALIISYGFNACWKIRTETMARDVTFRNRSPHSGAFNSNRNIVNPEWTVARPDKFDDGSGRQEVVNAFDGFGDDLFSIANDEVVQSAIIRGPIPQMNVNSELLNLARSVDRGTTDILLQPEILPQLGAVDFDTSFDVVSNLFRFGEMGIGNRTRRIPILYEIELDFIEEDPGYSNAVSQVAFTRDPLCLFLDQSSTYYSRFARYRDLHPRINSNFESRDHQVVIQNNVEPASDQVLYVPEAAGNKFINILNYDLGRATSDAERDAIQGRIDRLRDFVSRMSEIRIRRIQQREQERGSQRGPN
ncbi:MAG: TadE family protein [Planctomycetota bacterium]